jgi:(p)ppGpp synthase/HD superfamily hydrolase
MVSEARAFALRAHGGQMYGERPYSWHLEAVAELLAPYGAQAQVIAYLHDVVEDTAVSDDEVNARFGPFVGECVGLLTDAPAATRAERKAQTYARLAAVSGATELALVVKAADRLANVRSCVTEQRQRLWEMYRHEHRAFRAAAYRPGLCEPLWCELDRLLAPDDIPATPG